MIFATVEELVGSVIVYPNLMRISRQEGSEKNVRSWTRRSQYIGKLGSIKEVKSTVLYIIIAPLLTHMS